MTVSLSKITALEAALEYLIKATAGEKLEYLSPSEKAPGDTKIHTTPRGAKGYYPSEVARGEEDAEVPPELAPGEEQEVEVVQALEATPKLSSEYPKRVFDPDTEQYLRVVVPDNPDVHGVEPGIHRLSQPHGPPVRGTPISIYDPRIPDNVYHMTTNAPAVRASRKLIAGGVGGLGGDDRDQIVSLTINKEIAYQLAEDTKLASEVGRMGGGEYKSPERIKASKAIIKRLIQEMEKEGWDTPTRFREYADDHFEYMHESYNAKEWLAQYFTVRASATAKLGKEKLNPLFFTEPETLAKINPENVDVIEIPKSALRTGAMITDLDLDNPYGLQEIRIYGDVGVPEAKTSPDNLSKLLVLDATLDYLVKAIPEKREYLDPGEKAPKGFKEYPGSRPGVRYYVPGSAGVAEAEAPRELEPTEEREIEVVQALEAKTEIGSKLVEAYSEQFRRIVPRTPTGEAPTHLYRVMDRQQYYDAVEQGELKAAPNGDGRIFAAGEPRLQYSENVPTVLVAIEYSDDDGWKARSAHTGDAGEMEVSAVTDNSIPVSKVKVVAEGANREELLANYNLISNNLSPEKVGKSKQPWEMTQKEFESPAPLPQAKPGNIILYHATQEKNLDSILREGLDSTKWGGEGPQGVVWGVESPEGYSSGGVVIGVEIPESQLASVKGAEWLYARGSIGPDAIVYVDTPSEITGKRLRTERDNEYARAYHEWHVKEALAKGKHVPDEVLRDYPDLRTEAVSPDNFSKLLVLEMTLDYLSKATAEDEHREYDPEGFHEGPRHGHYFKPGEREAGGKEVEVVQAPEAETSYEMPQYDPSLEAYSQQYPDDVKVHNLTEADFEHYEKIGMQPDSKFAVMSKDVGATFFFGKTEEEAVEKLLTRQINKGVFLPPRLTPKPDWATDENDPFPKIPSDIKELHYDDIPDFYSDLNFGKALELEQSSGFKGSAKLLAKKAGEKDDIKSETFTDAFIYGEDREIDYLESANKIAQRLGGKVTPGEAKSFIKQIQAKTQDSLIHRGLPEKFYVFKGGKLHGENQIESTSLSPRAASKDYFSQKESDPYVAMYEVNRADVLVDVNAIKERYAGHLAAEDEEELVLQGKDLKNPIMIQLPNYMIKSEFYKSQANELSKLLVLDTALEYLAKSIPADGSIRIGNLDIPVEIPTDPIAGLSDRDSLVPGTGMLFDLDGHPVITMQGMKFPLDLVWMAGGRVVDLTENALVPVLGQESLYIPEAHATAVLEINGGEIQRLGIKIGDFVVGGDNLLWKQAGEGREYLSPGEKAPEGLREYPGSRPGVRYYIPRAAKPKSEGLMPESMRTLPSDLSVEEREIEVVQPEESTSTNLDQLPYMRIVQAQEDTGELYVRWDDEAAQDYNYIFDDQHIKLAQALGPDSKIFLGSEIEPERLTAYNLESVGFTDGSLDGTAEIGPIGVNAEHNYTVKVDGKRFIYKTMYGDNRVEMLSYSVDRALGLNIVPYVRSHSIDVKTLYDSFLGTWNKSFPLNSSTGGGHSGRSAYLNDLHDDLNLGGGHFMEFCENCLSTGNRDRAVIEMLMTKEGREEFIKIMLLDRITLNPDRHEGNWMLTDDHKIIAIDNGLAGGGAGTEGDLDSLAEVDPGAFYNIADFRFPEKLALSRLGGQLLTSVMEEKVGKEWDKEEYTKIMLEAFDSEVFGEEISNVFDKYFDFNKLNSVTEAVDWKVLPIKVQTRFKEDFVESVQHAFASPVTGLLGSLIPGYTSPWLEWF